MYTCISLRVTSITAVKIGVHDMYLELDLVQIIEQLDYDFIDATSNTYEVLV